MKRFVVQTTKDITVWEVYGKDSASETGCIQYIQNNFIKSEIDEKYKGYHLTHEDCFAEIVFHTLREEDDQNTTEEHEILPYSALDIQEHIKTAIQFYREQLDMALKCMKSKGFNSNEYKFVAGDADAYYYMAASLVIAGSTMHLFNLSDYPQFSEISNLTNISDYPEIPLPLEKLMFEKYYSDK